ncbi:P-loop containing nucleoside triphosphate hydrolase protein [Macrolepiota fuliginosa MF-IS2]|uniref:P-loop containing nucleoside triphosphate hydrolase protein n=1 Tax=Macrolepiota fuliginosa MF-IS2 TaxID=1400762 RepID=A0A9P6C6Y5_9AGAR|nr:P-loop containing nucleoside triphosphate hydrolase protein [Macrolepiota fuliginosa MF-IS2]
MPLASNDGFLDGTWLQRDEVAKSEGAFGSEWTGLEEVYSPPRFDWRKRAISRVGFDLSTPDKRKKYPKRKSPPLEPTQPGEPYFDAIESYQNHFLPLLESEEAESRNDILDRLSTWSLERLIQEGYCLSDTTGYWCKASQYGKPVAAFQIGPGIILPENLKLENGMQIMVSRADPLEETPYKGSIIERTKSQLRVCFPTAFDIEGFWRLDVDRTNVIFERMRKAISSLHYNMNHLEQLPRSEDQEHMLPGTGLRDILLRSEDPSRTSVHEGYNFHALQESDDISYPKDALSHDVREFSAKEFEGVFKGDIRIHSWAERHSLDNPLVMEGDPDLAHLNKSQVKAMATMISKRISLVQGPPGTGKTKTIIETIKLLKNHFEVPHPILVCTYTNVAVDNLVEGFVKAGLKPLRAGFGSLIRASLKDYSLDYLLTKHPLQPLCLETTALLENLEDEISQLSSRLSETIKKLEQGSTSSALKQRAENMYKAMAMKDRQQNQLKGKIYGLQQEMLHDIVKSADVVCTTCISSASTALNVSDFPVVFVDEASMSTEPATLIPIMKGSQHLALIGDHKQLPPIIVSQEAQSQGLGVSLFERLTEEGIVPSVMLDIQYRMHPSISYFPSSEFYNNSIQDGTKDAEGNVMSGLEPPLSTTHLLQDGKVGEGHRSRPSVIFLDHFGYESMSGRSRVNHHEAQIVVSLVEDLLLHNPVTSQ